MTESNKFDVCRLCHTSTGKLNELTQHLTNIIFTCFSIKIHVFSQVAHRICQLCIDQLGNIYKYRKRIVRNELILYKKFKDNINKHLEKLYFKDLQKDYDNNEEKNKVKCDINDSVDDIDITDGESDLNESTMTYEDIDTEMKNEKTSTSLNTEENFVDLKKQEQGVNVESVWQNFKLDNMKSVNINIVQDNNINGITDMKLSNPDAIIDKQNEHENNVVTNKKPATVKHPVTFELVNQDSTLQTNKENTDMNNFKDNDTANFNDLEFYAINMDKKFMCLTCLQLFESQKELSNHYKTVELTRALKDMSRKYTLDDGNNLFKCGVCSKSFENKALVIKHAQIHKVERPFQCKLCSRTYKTVADILRHSVVHNGFKFVCSYKCGYTTVHMGALREHVKRHKKEFKYKCEKCGKCFQVKTWYVQHQNIHDKVSPFVCKLCGQAFSMSRYLTAHQANVHPQSSKVKRYKCAQCALPCDSRKTLVIHMKQKHGMQTDCLCDVCGLILPDQRKLMLHKSIHERIRKFSCRFCKKTFNKKDHRTVHEKIHTGERYNCTSCPKTFTQRCSLRRHIKRYHPGDHNSLEQKTEET